MEYIYTLLDVLLHLNIHLTAILAEYGTLMYSILFALIFCETGLVLFPFLPGDSLLFAVGAITANTGQLDIHILIPLLIIAALLGDHVNYFVGKFLGQKIKARRRIGFFKHEYIEHTEAYYAKYGGRTLIIARFIPIIRTVAPFVAGAGNMKYSRFIVFCVTGAVLWVAGLLLLGYQFGNMQQMRDNFELVILLITIVSVSPVVHQIWQILQSRTIKA
jgi:membrane-associated protein